LKRECEDVKVYHRVITSSALRAHVWKSFLAEIDLASRSDILFCQLTIYLFQTENASGLEKNATDGDRDSGHGGSPTRETPNAQDTDDESNYPYEAPTATATKKSGNFWRRFTMKSRNKR
jgi:hypothetical protein